MKREEVIEIRQSSLVTYKGYQHIDLDAFANEVERRTIERCAEVADGADKYNRHISREIAAGIRALANQQEKQ